MEAHRLLCRGLLRYGCEIVSTNLCAIVRDKLRDLEPSLSLTDGCPFRFRDIHPSHRMKAIALGPQLLLQLAEHLLFFSTRLNAFDSFAIHTWRAPVGFYLFPCLPKHVRAPYLVVQTVELHSFRLLGCAI